LDTNIVILYDNNWFGPHLEAAWGFSCLVRGLEKTILFDTGGDGHTLLGNMRQVGVEPAEIDIVVLSHFHGDHTGGLRGFLEKNPHVAVYLPGSFSGNFKKAVMSVGARVEEVFEAKELCRGAYTTGELGDAIREQARAAIAFVPTVVKEQPMNWGAPVMSRNAPSVERP
jgi:7,8-dihydropterin-6-yl-methyl-4-(beta-D-ribofuranosyl)aminobenzene 5'-phosphate synthase